MAGKRKVKRELVVPAYDGLMGGIAQLLERSRHTAARAVNSILTATYWEIGRRSMVVEQLFYFLENQRLGPSQDRIDSGSSQNGQNGA